MGFRQELIGKVRALARPSRARPAEARAASSPAAPRRGRALSRCRRAASSSAPRPAGRRRSATSCPASGRRCGRCRSSSCSTCRRSSRRSSRSISRRRSGFRRARRSRASRSPADTVYVAPGRAPYGLGPRPGPAAGDPARRRRAGEFLPAGGRRALPRRRGGVRRLRARRRPHRHGLGRAPRRAGARRGGRRPHRAGRGDEHGLGHAGPCARAGLAQEVLPLEAIAPALEAMLGGAR